MLTWWHDDNNIIADLADLDDPDEPDDLGDQEEVKDLNYYCYYLINLKYRSKSFKEGGESFILVAVVTDVSQDVTEGERGRHMWVLFRVIFKPAWIAWGCKSCLNLVIFG